MKSTGSVADRLMSKCISEPNSGCWLWTDSLSTYGYGRIRVGKRVRKAHQVSYEIHVGPIPEGLHLDHLCAVRACINPAHLEPVTCRENLLRSPATLAGINVRKDTCKRGHPFDDENTIVYVRRDRSGPMRRCRTCEASRGKRAARLYPEVSVLVMRDLMAEPEAV
jgi:hypothetical protein